ncbi:hypothetical protein MNBD_DELTA01-1839 [hydrothermal vent metagenome]|uniref:Uncharacterized protein n=1 Tax=hydrothermal vent metagenome TaxID=652676 RepID=A0A3B0QWV0_9ZZZZ
MKLKAALLSILMMAMVFVSFNKAEALEADGSAGVDVLSNYVWRGQNLVNDSGVLQPTLDVALKNGLGFNYWSNYNMNNGEVTETDITLTYSRDYGKLSTTTGYIHYGLDSAPDTEEIFVSLSYDTFLSPSITIYQDIDLGDGQFVVFAIGHSINIGNFYGKDVALNLGASASYNFEDGAVMGMDAKGKEFNGFYNGELSASLTIPVTKNITVEPKIAYTGELSDDADAAISALNVGYGTGKDTEVLYGGVNISMNF